MIEFVGLGVMGEPDLDSAPLAHLKVLANSL
jgi:hypothetical protein